MNASDSSSARTSFVRQAAGVLLLLAALGFLFRRSAQPGMVLFANDAPLGALVAHAETAHQAFTGHWQPYSWIGFQDPSAMPSLTMAFYLLLGSPVLFYKLYAPFSLFVLGMSAWLLFRRLGFGAPVAALAGTAAALNADPFSYSAWGLSSHTLAMAFGFLALAAVAGPSSRHVWLRLVLSGAAIGLSIMEGYDNGALLSLYVAAFIAFQAWQGVRQTGRRALHIAARTAVTAVVAGITAYAALITLVGTQVQGVADMSQDPATKERRWLQATIASLPKLETLGLFVPGLFGHTIKSEDGHQYWGRIGQAPGHPTTRHSAAGLYAGVFVMLVAIWAMAQAMRGKHSCFSIEERRAVLFWSGAALLSLVLAWGRFAPVYQFFYALPYISTIRNPVKFIHPLSMSLVILFGYGLHGLVKTCFAPSGMSSPSIGAGLRRWWTGLSGWDRHWTYGLLAASAAGILSWFIYASSRSELLRHLTEGGFPEAERVAIASHSIAGVGWFAVYLALGTAAFCLVMARTFAGSRARAGWILLGLITVPDLIRANQPWLIYYDYRDRYASNPLLDTLREIKHDARVTARMNPMGQFLTQDAQFHNLLTQLYYDLWLQNHFPYYRIHSSDIIQAPRMQAMDELFLRTIAPQVRGNQAVERVDLAARLWELTSTKYFITDRSFVELLNGQIDAAQRRFRVVQTYGLAPKAGRTPKTAADLLVRSDPQGPLALVEFGGALPRARLYSQWQIITDDARMLERLTEPDFNPRESVLVAGEVAPTTGGTAEQPSGSVEITRYQPKEVALKARATAESVLLLNDRWTPDWKVFVDGTERPLLRCNYIMRGVALSPGEHTVEFRFAPSSSPLYVSLTALLACGVIAGFLGVDSWKTRRPIETPVPARR